MIEELAYRVKTDVFEGPFDVLLKAIAEGKVDVYQVSISRIVTAYLEYWQDEGPPLLLASDFVCMAAYLIELKSRGLLPAREEIIIEEEIEQSLVGHIQEYEVYKKIAHALKERQAVFERIYGRHEGEKVESEIELKDVSLRDLVVAFQKVYREAAEREKILSIKAEKITLEGRLSEIKQLLAERKEGLPFEDLFIRKTRLEVVVTFLAVLELAKQQLIAIVQDRRFGSIMIFGRDEN